MHKIGKRDLSSERMLLITALVINECMWQLHELQMIYYLGISTRHKTLNKNYMWNWGLVND